MKAVSPPDKGGQGGFRGSIFPDFSNQTGIKYHEPVLSVKVRRKARGIIGPFERFKSFPATEKSLSYHRNIFIRLSLIAFKKHFGDRFLSLIAVKRRSFRKACAGDRSVRSRCLPKQTNKLSVLITGTLKRFPFLKTKLFHSVFASKDCGYISISPEHIAVIMPVGKEGLAVPPRYSFRTFPSLSKILSLKERNPLSCL